MVSLKSQNLTLNPIKFLCSYGGRIVPRHPDGKLRYYGGETRVLSVDCSISFSELLVKMGLMCGSPVSLRCQLPTEDLDALVSITSDEDLANLIEEYDREAAPPSSVKIRAFLFVPKAVKQVSPPPTPPISPLYSSTSSAASGIPPRCPTSTRRRHIRRTSRPPAYPSVSEKAAGKMKISHKCAHHGHHHHQYNGGHGNGGLIYLIHNSKFWQ